MASFGVTPVCGLAQVGWMMKTSAAWDGLVEAAVALAPP